MKEPWPRIRIDELCERIVDCLNRTAPIVDGPTEFKMIRTTNVRDGWIDLSEVRHVDEPTFNKWTRREKPRRGDIVLTREAPLGEVGMIRTDDAVFLGQRTVLYRADPNKLDNRYLLYVFQGEDIQQQIRALGSGSTVEHMRVPDAKEPLVPLPDLKIQNRIGEILGSIDGLIENNVQRIVSLEKMVRRIFEEWFVRYRAPGCETAAAANSRVGTLPNGWRAGYVEDISSFVSRGISPSYAEDGLSIVINQKCIRDGRLSLGQSRRQSKPVSKEKTVVAGDILINSTGVGTLGRVAQVERIGEQVTVDSHVTIVRAKPNVDRDFFGLALLRLQPALEELGVGSTGQTELGRDRIKMLNLTIPPENVQEAFGRIVRPLRELAHVLDLQNNNLRTQLGLLLPKLVSGEIDVLRADGILEAAE